MDGQALSAEQAPLPLSRVSIANNKWAAWSMYLLMAYPLVDYTLRLHGIHPLGVLWDKVVLIILCVLALVRYFSGYRAPKAIWPKFALWFILFTCGLMFSGMDNPLVAIQGFRIDVYYLLYGLLIPFVVGPGDVRKLLHIGGSVAILIAISGIYQYITRAPIPVDWVSPGEHVRTRVFSVLMSPNELGSYMALSTPILVGLAMSELNRWRKWMYGVGAVLCIAAMFFTLTRGAWVALAVAALLVAIFFEWRLFLVLVVVGIVGFFLPPIHHRIADLLSPVYWIKSAQGGRIARWLMAFDKMSLNPLIGVGVGQYGGAVSSQYGTGIYSDNYYAKTLGETGLIGLTLFISMHLALLRDVFVITLKKASKRDRYLALGGIIGLAAVVVHNSMENVFEFAPMAASYFTYAALFIVWGTGFGEQGDGKDA